MKSRKLILLSSLALASLTLTACGATDESVISNSTQTTSHTTTEIKAEVKTDTKKTTATGSKPTEKDSATKSETPANKEDVVSETKADEDPTEKPTSINNSQVNLEAIVVGDYSSLAGTWTNANGVQMIFDGQNISTVDRDGQRHDGDYLSNLSIADGLLGGSISNVDAKTGAVFMVIPAGTPSRHYGKVYDTDVICIGHSVDCELDPFVR